MAAKILIFNEIGGRGSPPLEGPNEIKDLKVSSRCLFNKCVRTLVDFPEHLRFKSLLSPQREKGAWVTLGQCTPAGPALTLKWGLPSGRVGRALDGA